MPLLGLKAQQSSLGQDKLLGDVTHITAMGCGDLINHGCHFYDTALMLMGDPEPIWARGKLSDVSRLS